MIGPTWAATSMPTSSSRVIGPAGQPQLVSALSMVSIAAPSIRMKLASFMYGAKMREV